MKTSFWAMLYWISGFVANVGLVYVLMARARWKDYRIFSAFVAFQVLRTVTLFAVRINGLAHAYYLCYWSLAVLDYLLQGGLITEIGLVVLRPFVTAVPEAKNKVIVWSVASIVFAAAISSTIFPGPPTGGSIWDTRISLFTSLITAQCYVVLSSSINRLGIRMKAHILAIGNGLVIWNAVALIRDGAYAATGWRREFPFLNQVEMIAYIGATVYWAFALWREEPLETQDAASKLAAAYEQLITQQSTTMFDEAGKRAS